MMNCNNINRLLGELIPILPTSLKLSSVGKLDSSSVVMKMTMYVLYSADSYKPQVQTPYKEHGWGVVK